MAVMAPTIMHSRWGAQIEGEPIDIANLRAKLNGSVSSPQDLFVTKFNEVSVLRSGRWDRARNPAEAQTLATEDLRVLVSCLALLDGCDDLTIGTIFEFDGDDNFANRQRDSSVRIIVRKHPDEQAAPAELRKALLATDDPHLRALMVDYRPDPFWYDIYKGIESLEDYYVARATTLYAHFAAQSGAIRLMKRTANSYRHRQLKYAAVAGPMSLQNAAILFAEITKKTLDDIEPAPDPECQFAVRDFSFPAGTIIALNRLTLGPNTAE